MKDTAMILQEEMDNYIISIANDLKNDQQAIDNCTDEKETRKLRIALAEKCISNINWLTNSNSDRALLPGFMAAAQYRFMGERNKIKVIELYRQYLDLRTFPHDSIDSQKKDRILNIEAMIQQYFFYAEWLDELLLSIVQPNVDKYVPLAEVDSNLFNAKELTELKELMNKGFNFISKQYTNIHSWQAEIRAYRIYFVLWDLLKAKQDFLENKSPAALKKLESLLDEHYIDFNYVDENLNYYIKGSKMKAYIYDLLAKIYFELEYYNFARNAYEQLVKLKNHANPQEHFLKQLEFINSKLSTSEI